MRSIVFLLLTGCLGSTEVSVISNTAPDAGVAADDRIPLSPEALHCAEPWSPPTPAQVDAWFIVQGPPPPHSCATVVMWWPLDPATQSQCRHIVQIRSSCNP